MGQGEEEGREKGREKLSERGKESWGGGGLWAVVTVIKRILKARK